MGSTHSQETHHSVQQRYEARKIVEVAVIEKLHPQLNPAMKKEFMQKASYLDSMDSAEIEEFAFLHRDFHLEFAQATQNPYLVRMLNSVINPSSMVSNAVRVWSRKSDIEIHTHVELVNEAFSDDLEVAINAFKTHVTQGMNLELETIS